MFSSKTCLSQPWLPRKHSGFSQNSGRSVLGLLSVALQDSGFLPSSPEILRSSVPSGGLWTSGQCRFVLDLFGPPAGCTLQEMATVSDRTSVKTDYVTHFTPLKTHIIQNKMQYWACVMNTQSSEFKNPQLGKIKVVCALRFNKKGTYLGAFCKHAWIKYALITNQQ